MTEIWVRANGDPIPQGSKTARVINGRAIMYDSHPNLKAWRENVGQAIWRAMHGQFEIDELAGPLAVTIWFYIERPKTVTRTHPSVKPDIDKLVRAILDAATSASAWDDDSQVVYISARKQYADDGKPGCMIHIRNVED